MTVNEGFSRQMIAALVRGAQETLERKWGKRWRACFVPDIQRALVESYVLGMVLSWPGSFTRDDILGHLTVIVNGVLGEDT